MKVLLVAISLVVAITAQGYNYPAPQVHHENVEETQQIEQAIAPAPEYLPPAQAAPAPAEIQPEYVPPPQQPQPEYLPPAPVHIPAPANIEPVHVPAPAAPVPVHVAAPSAEYIPPQGALHDDGYRYRTVKRYRLRRH